MPPFPIRGNEVVDISCLRAVVCISPAGEGRHESERQLLSTFVLATRT